MFYGIFFYLRIYIFHEVIICMSFDFLESAAPLVLWVWKIICWIHSSTKKKKKERKDMSTISIIFFLFLFLFFFVKCLIQTPYHSHVQIQCKTLHTLQAVSQSNRFWEKLCTNVYFERLKTYLERNSLWQKKVKLGQI